MRTTHTVAEMEVSPACYDEIANRLRAFTVDHYFDGGPIDMGGLALTRGPEGRPGNVWPVVFILASLSAVASVVGLVVRWLT